MTELYVFGGWRHARASGFGEDGRFRGQGSAGDAPRMMAWWPERGDERLRGVELSRVIVTDGFRRWLHGAAAAEHRRAMEALNTMRVMLRLPPSVWIEL